MEELWNGVNGPVQLDTIKSFHQDCSQFTNRAVLKENGVYLLWPRFEEKKCTSLRVMFMPVTRHLTDFEFYSFDKLHTINKTVLI